MTGTGIAFSGQQCGGQLPVGNLPPWPILLDVHTITILEQTFEYTDSGRHRDHLDCRSSLVGNRFMTPKMTVNERRARVGTRHLLGRQARAQRAETVADALVALHATDPATVHLSAAARLSVPGVPETERALYDDRSLIRMLGMRRTVFVVSRDDAPVMQAACTNDIAGKQRRLLVKHLSEQGYPENVPGADGWLADVAGATADALAARGSATAQELAEAEPRLRQQLLMAKGKPYEAVTNVTSRVLFLLAAEGRIVRGRPRGSWLSTQYRWCTMGDWLPGGLPALDPDVARAELARRWLRAFGPALPADLRWWSGWTTTQLKKTLAAIAPVEIELDGEPGLVLPDDLAPVPEPEPWVALLPALDPTPMGWAGREWFLGEHAAALFDNTGNIGPTVWSNGRIVGGWAQGACGEIRYRLLEDVGSEVDAEISRQAERLGAWLGETRLTPRFRTPLERDLAG